GAAPSGCSPSFCAAQTVTNLQPLTKLVVSGVREVTDEHFFPALQTANSVYGRVRYAQVVLGVVEQTFNNHARTGRQNHRLFHTVGRLPCEVVVRDVDDFFNSVVRVNYTSRHGLATVVHVSTETVQSDFVFKHVGSSVLVIELTSRNTDLVHRSSY